MLREEDKIADKTPEEEPEEKMIIIDNVKLK